MKVLSLLNYKIGGTVYSIDSSIAIFVTLITVSSSAFASQRCHKIFDPHLKENTSEYWSEAPFRGSRNKAKAWSLASIIEYSATEFGVRPSYINATKNTDTKILRFDDFQLQGSRFQYRDLPLELRTESDLLFRGEEALTLNSAKQRAQDLFKYGWTSSARNPHRDVNRHVLDSEGSKSSGFLSTSKNTRVAGYFAGMQKYGMIWMIDPAGAEILQVSKFLKHQNAHEEEVLISNHLPAHKIIGVIILDTKRDPVKILLNSNYTKEH